MQPKRYLELDFLRAIAILMMILFHFLFDLNLIFKTKINLKYWNIPIYVLFFLLVGTSCFISYQNYLKKITSPSLFSLIFYFLKRIYKIFLAAMIVSVASYFFDKRYTIFFGTLHFITVAIFATAFILHWSKKKLFALALFCFFFGYFLRKNGAIWIFDNILSDNLSFFIELKNFFIKVDRLRSFDYYPFLPYFYLVIMGIIIGKIFYGEKKLFFFNKRQVSKKKKTCKNNFSPVMDGKKFSFTVYHSSTDFIRNFIFSKKDFFLKFFTIISIIVNLYFKNSLLEK